MFSCNKFTEARNMRVAGVPTVNCLHETGNCKRFVNLNWLSLEDITTIVGMFAKKFQLSLQCRHSYCNQALLYRFNDFRTKYRNRTYAQPHPATLPQLEARFLPGPPGVYFLCKVSSMSC